MFFFSFWRPTRGQEEWGRTDGVAFLSFLWQHCALARQSFSGRDWRTGQGSDKCRKPQRTEVFLMKESQSELRRSPSIQDKTQTTSLRWGRTGRGISLRFCNMTEPQWVCSEDRSRWMVLATSLIYVYVCIYKHFAAVIAASGASTKHRIEGPALVQIWYSPFPL